MEPRKLLAVAWAVHSALFAMVAIGVALWFVGFGVLAATLPDSTTGEPLPPVASAIIGGCGVFSGCFFLVALVPGSLAAAGLWLDRPWGRFGALVAALLSLFSGVPWMFLGIATLIWLWKDREASLVPPA